MIGASSLDKRICQDQRVVENCKRILVFDVLQKLAKGHVMHTG